MRAFLATHPEYGMRKFTGLRMNTGVEEYLRNSPEYDRQIDLRLYYDGTNIAINIYDTQLKPIGK